VRKIALFFIALLAMTAANAYTTPPKESHWDTYYPKGYNVVFDFHVNTCNEAQAAAIERAVDNYTVYTMNQQDPHRTYTYQGRVSEFTVDNEVVSIGCQAREDMTYSEWPNGTKRYNEGETIPQDNCRLPMPGDVTRCIRNVPRHLTGASIKICDCVSADNIGWIIQHELTHAFTIGHSTRQGSTMIIAAFISPRARQTKETWGRDTWCAIHEKIPDLLEWPLKESVVDDKANLRVPRVRFLGAYWEFYMLQITPGNWIPTGLKLVQDCAELKE